MMTRRKAGAGALATAMVAAAPAVTVAQGGAAMRCRHRARKAACR